jgi:hypothetical protein
MWTVYKQPGFPFPFGQLFCKLLIDILGGKQAEKQAI